jgi:uncharacterized protein YukE
MFIKVNHKDLVTVGKSIVSYNIDYFIELDKAKRSVFDMQLRGWKGADAEGFFKKWSEIDDNDSVSHQFTKALGEFSDNIRATAKSYQKAQEDSYNEAYKLSR